MTATDLRAAEAANERRLREAKDAAEHDLTVAIKQERLASALLASKLRREDGVYIAADEHVAAFRARVEEVRAAEARADAAHEAWEQAR